MKFVYETDRLILKILDSCWSKEVLQFYSDDKAIFEPFETLRPDNYYTEEYHASLLSAEYHMTLKSSGVRFWIFENNNPAQIIGTISFQNIVKGSFLCCSIGYKFASHYQHKGYALESLRCGIHIMFHDLCLHRIEAYVMPHNFSSKTLLLRLGFRKEGIAYESAKIRGIWEDHERYSLLNPKQV